MPSSFAQREVYSEAQRLDNLYIKSVQACGDDLEMRAEWARYLCVLYAGLIEKAVKEIYSDFAYKKVADPIARYVSVQVGRIRSPKCTSLLETVAAFKQEWRDELATFVADEGRAEAIDSIMTNRHLIAHGKHSDSRISLAQLDEYRKKAVAVLELMEEQCRR